MGRGGTEAQEGNHGVKVGMADDLKHLVLPSYGEPFRKKSRGFPRYTKTDRDFHEFAESQAALLDKIGENHGPVPEFPEYDQRLIFKIKTEQRVPDKRFRRDLKTTGCDTIVSKPGKKVEWVMATDDARFTKLKSKLQTRADKDAPSFVDAIGEFAEFDAESRIGKQLAMQPLEPDASDKLIVSLNRTRPDRDRIAPRAALALIRRLARDRSLTVHDELIAKNSCVMLLDVDRTLLDLLIRIDAVALVDRPPSFQLERMAPTGPVDVGDSKGSPPLDAHGVMVMDSGIVPHPLLKNAVYENGWNMGLPDMETRDDRAHGTRVAGTALYGDIRERIRRNDFGQEIWICSAKVFYQDGETPIPLGKLLETRIRGSLKKMREMFPKCRIVNMSFGRDGAEPVPPFDQYSIAPYIDELAVEHDDVIFVVSAGNIQPEFCEKNEYPDYLVGDSAEIRISDPAISAHAITVGALEDSEQQHNIPSRITRVGPGINCAIKPELVETGGGPDNPVLVLNHDFRYGTFSTGIGTSHSTPKISHYLAKLINRFPNRSRNLIIALLISSATVPDYVPPKLLQIGSQAEQAVSRRIANIYGYGKPDLRSAEFSSRNRAVFTHEGTIGIKQVQCFALNLPHDFVQKSGKRKISITLVFDPPVDPKNRDYVGFRMEFHMFKNQTVEDIARKYRSESEAENDFDEFLAELQRHEIKLMPGSAARKKTNHQKGTIVLSSRFLLSTDRPLVLAVLAQAKHELAADFKQRFAVVVTVEHDAEIDLYGQIEAINLPKAFQRITT